MTDTEEWAYSRVGPWGQEFVICAYCGREIKREGIKWHIKSMKRKSDPEHVDKTVNPSE